MSEKTVPDNFFRFLIPILERLWPSKTIACSDPTNVIGNVGVVGSKNNPGISSAVKLIVGESFVWVPCPTVYEDAAAIFFDGSREIVLPVIRLCEKTDSKENKPKYYSSDKWIEFFISEMKFKIIEAESKPKDKEERPELKLKTIAEFLENSTPKTGLPVLAATITYAIFGVRKYDEKLFELNKEKLIFSEMPPLHRPVDKTPLGKEVAKSVFITIGIRKNKDAPWEISTELTAEKYRFKFDINDPDFGLDPFHTPENEKIRLTGRLAVGVKIDDDKNLILPTSGKGKLHLAKSTAQIPFAGNNDPRRLLMGANAQVKAVQLCKNDPPLVRTNQDNESCRPFGINLKVGYLAWQGLNHEDAWVLSKSAAEKLSCEEKKDVFISIRSFESEPKILVKKDDRVVFNQDLIERSLNEDLLCLNDAVAENIRQQIRRLNEKAPFKGIVTEVKIKDFLKKETVPEYFEDELIMNFKKMIIITIEGKRDLEVGDKLANRHGHKGVVGAILSDDEMPQWRGQPLEALIDPITVLNRSNWGQIFETLYGGLANEKANEKTVISVKGISKADWNKVKPEDCDENGRFQIDPPKSSCWMKRKVSAVAGMQFIMRMPQHASQRISASSKTDDPTLRMKEQRFGEMDCWAQWANQTDFKPKTNCELNSNAKKFQRLLFMGGYKINVDYTTRISKVGEGEPWNEYTVGPLSWKENWGKIVVLSEKNPKKSFKTQSELWEELDSIEVGENRYIQIDQDDGVLDKKSLVEQLNKEENKEAKIIEYSEKYKIPKQTLKYWLRQFVKNKEEYKEEYKPIKYISIIPKKDRPEFCDFRGQIQNNELTNLLNRIVKLVLKYEKTNDLDEKINHYLKIQIVAEELRRVAYQLAVGKNWQGNKSSVLRREVLGYPLAPSVRATVVPGGSNLLGVDEVGVPKKLAEVLLKTPNITDEELDSVLKKTWFWIKRDPVLHRWGLMPVRARIIEGNVIRLPASFLGPMGADFDGDTVAMFENTMIKSVGDYNKLLSKLACSKKEFGDISDIKMLYPKKQYLFGLYKLINDETKFKNFVDCLGKDFSELGNFKCVDELCVDEFLNKWVALAGDNKSEESNGKYWGILEEHALLALSEEPDMGLGLFDFHEIKALPVIKCRAAKDIDEKFKLIIEGKSLDSYSNPPIVGCSDDPIANVMVKSKIVVSKFGGVLRRLIYNIPETKIEPKIIAKAQALAEYITQKVLSVKAGEKPVSYEPYAKIIKNLLSREPDPKIEDLKENLKETDLEKYVDFLKSFKKDFGTSKSESWLEWLREPHKLKDIYETLKEEYIPTKEDMRIGAWLES